MAVRQTRGRQKIPMRLIQNQDDLYASFSKRRLGLFKKASELSTLCGVDIGVVVFSPTNNPFSFFSPSMESVLERYISPAQPLKLSARAIDYHTQARIEELNKRLDEAVEEKHSLKRAIERLDDLNKTRTKTWWEETPIHALDKDQVRDWIAWFKNFKAQIEDQLHGLQNQNEGIHQLQNISTSVHNHDNLPSYTYEAPAADQFLSSQYFDVSTQNEVINVNHFSPPLPPLALPLNLSGGGGGGQYYYGGGESSINAPSSPCFYRPLPSRMGFDFESSSSHVFSPQYHNYVSPGDQDPFGGGGGGLEQHACPAPTTEYQDEAGFWENEQNLQSPVAAASMSFPAHYRHVPTGAQNLSAAAETNEGRDR